MKADCRTASAPRRRLQACERCWKRKQKCDKLLPACTACVEADAQCDPRRISIGHAPNEGNGLSHVAVPNYVETLKRKVGELDGQHRRQRARLNSEVSIELQGSPSIETTDTENQRMPSHTPGTANTSMSEQSVQAAMGEIGFLSRNAMAEPRCEARGFPQALAMNNMVRAALSVSGDNPFLSSLPSYRHQKLVTMVGPTGRLSRVFAAPYLDCFLNHIGSTFLHIDPLEMKRYFDTFFDERDTENAGVPYRDFNVYMMVAIAMMLTFEPGIELFASSMYSAAMESFNIILEDHDSLAILRCIFLVIIYSTYSPSGGSTWHLLGLAMRKSISLRLHRETHHDTGISLEESDNRRNFFWSLYILDRTVGCVLDRPFNVQDDDISLNFPIRNSQTSVNFDFGCHMIMHARLMSGIRASSSELPVFHYGNLCYWKDTAKSFRSHAHSSNDLPIPVTQLTCRALIQIVQLSRRTTSYAGVIGRIEKVNQESLDICEAYIDEEYCRFEQNDFAGSFIDGLDLFAAGVLAICVPSAPLLAGHSKEQRIISKCTGLLSSIGGRFSPFKALPRVLWALSTVASHGTSNDQILEDLPDIIPDAIQDTIEFCRRCRAET